jgi:hypothetical protein
VTLTAALSSSAHAAVAGEKRLNNGLGIKPALGWNSWVSTYLCHIFTKPFFLLLNRAPY